jgi:hypothetical protein
MTAPSVTWGETLGLRVTKAGGMPRVAARLREIYGPVADSRSTLDKLRALSGPESMDDDERWRAYQVLVLIGADPAEWGIARSSLAVPPGLVDYFHRAIDAPSDPGGTAETVKSLEQRQSRRKSRREVSDTPSYVSHYAALSNIAASTSVVDACCATAAA